MKYSSKIIYCLAICLSSATLFASEYQSTGQSIEEASIGKGFNSRNKGFKGYCITGQSTEVGNPDSDISLTMTTDTKALDKEFGFSANAKFKYAGGSTSVSAEYAKKSQTNNRSLNYLFTAYYNLPNEEIRNVQIIEKFDNLDDLKWFEACGDKFVSQLIRKVSLIIHLKIDFASKSDKELFKANFKMKNTLNEAGAALKNSRTAVSQKTKVSLWAKQIGGDVGGLGKILKEAGAVDESGITNFTKCSMGTLEACQKYLTSVQTYISTTLTDQLSREIEGTKVPLATRGYILKPYTELAKFPTIPSSSLVAVLRYRKLIDGKFDQNLAFLGKSSSLLEEDPYPLTKGQREKVGNFHQLVINNLNKLSDLASICYDHIDQCETEFLSSEEKKEIVTLDDEQLVVEPQMFKQFCYEGMSKNSPNKLSETINTIIEVAKANSPEVFSSEINDQLDICDKANSVLKDMKVFDVTKLDTSKVKSKMLTLEPLMDMNHFEVMDLSNQKIEELIHLRDFNHLSKLILANNNLRGTSDLPVLKNLEYLDLSSNNIRSLAGLEQNQSVRLLDLRNLPMEEYTCPELKKLEVCKLESYLGQTQIIAQATRSDIPMNEAGISILPDKKIFISRGYEAEIFDLNKNQYTPVGKKLLAPRYNHSATALLNGDVLLVGGEKGGNYDAEIYRQETQDFEQIRRELQVPRARHEALRLDDGRVLITGGWEADGGQWNINSASNTAEIYDPESNTLKALPAMYAARLWHKMTKLQDGRVLITGGFSNGGGQAIAEIFDPKTNQFHLVDSFMGDGRAAHSANLMQDGRVLIAGGISSLYDGTRNNRPKDSIEYFDPITESFSYAPVSLAEPRAFHSANTLSSGHTLFLGGMNSISNYLLGSIGNSCVDCVATPEIFNPLERSISSIGTNTLSYPRAVHNTFEIDDNKLIIMGGIDSRSANSVEVFTHNLKRQALY